MPLAVDRMSAPLKNGADIFYGAVIYCALIRSHLELNPCA